MRNILLHLTLTALFLAGIEYPSKSADNLHLSSTTASQPPVVLVQNNGQVKSSFQGAPDEVLFYAYQNEMSIFLQGNCISYQFFDGSFRTEKTGESFRTDMVLVGAQKPSKIEALNENDYFETHYSSSEKKVIVSHSFERIVLNEVYPGIDWVVYATKNGIKYDFIVHPGADANMIQLMYKHANNVSITTDGGLEVETKLGKIQEGKPFSYTNSGTEVKSAFHITGNIVTFDIETYNKQKTLTIDPDVVWTSYLGGSGYDEARAICADEAGNTYMTGFTSATNGIATGGYQTNYGGGNYDAFITKFNVAGQRIWTTYFGGNGSDFGSAIALDSGGNIFIAGTTASTTGIAVNGGLLDYAGGLYDGFAAKFSPNGMLQWSTYLGGIQEDNAVSIAIGEDDRCAILCQTKSNDVFVNGAYQSAFGGGISDMLLTYLNNDGTFEWNTFIGKTGDENPGAVVISEEYISVVGSTSSTSDIAIGGPQTTYGGGVSDGYFGVFNLDGTLNWSTYIGGAGEDLAHQIAINRFNDVFISGSTNSSTGIATPGASQTTFGGGEFDAFLGQFSLDGAENWMTYLGGEGLDKGNGVAVDELGGVFIGGITSSLLNIFDDGFQVENAGGTDLLFAFYDSFGVKKWSSYFGGSDDETMFSMAADENSRAIFAGSTQSNGVAFNGWDTSYGGSTDALFGKIQDCNNPYVTVDVLGDVMFCQGESIGLTVGGADFFDWSTGDSTTVIAVDTTMSVYVIGRMDGTDCMALSNVVEVQMMPAPEVITLAEGPTEWCGIGEVMLFAESEMEDVVFTWSTSEVGEALLVFEDGSYTCTVVGENGCEGTSDPIVITVTPAPTVVAAINTDVTCISTPQVNMIALPLGGTFIGEGVVGSQFIPELAGGGYHEIYYEFVSEEGCTGQSEILGIEVLFEETVLFVDANEMCVFDQPIGMYGYPEGGYYTGAGVSGNMFYPEIAGPGEHEVAYVFTDGNGCANNGVQTIIVDACVGVSEVDNNEISIYPNPVQNTLFFQLNNASLTRIEIIDAIGKVVYQTNFSNGMSSLPTSDLAVGFYTIKFIENQKSFVKQFMKI